MSDKIVSVRNPIVYSYNVITVFLPYLYFETVQLNPDASFFQCQYNAVASLVIRSEPKFFFYRLLALRKKIGSREEGYRMLYAQWGLQ